ncbi:uncharacterized protein IL334_000656 [Kwoniella shivajii]|uniref:Trafficking protein particle complex subunit 11 domain-containing protein n=1 Tax=Kwoniella shivajii TaxID=564305 RepID=A0ABZ1CQ81_9TREE|nr:hypothetical protein IL334_000656 [Kwoniella shivajii]
MPRPVTITYTLHPSPTPSTSNSTQVLQSAISGIKSHLPLRNLHWKSSTRTSIRTIQEVDIELVELGEINSVRDNLGGIGGNGSSVLDTPLVNLCLVVCEDAEVYKNQTRSFIRDWLSLLAARRTPHAPLIVLVNPPNPAGHAAGGKSVWGKDKGVLGKLKTDFNVGKRDRCVQLNLPQVGSYDPAAWPEVMNKLKESLVSAFDSAIIEREEEVKRGEAQRLNVGWNFCTWFLLKESLANSFESVNLPEDSLLIYEELEASFFQVLKEQNLSWFGISKLGATHPGDDSLPILDTTVKPYRELMRSSMISIFDFRIYLFARQGQLLGKLGRITEVAKRGQWFVASLTRRLREAEESLAQHFIESWTYTACMDIVDKCDQWSRIDRPNGDYSGLVAYESARSELLDIARIQVERIGVSSGHLPPIYPFNPASSPYPSTIQEDVLFESSSNGLSDDEELQHTPQSASEQRPILSNEQLIDAQQDEGNCRALYAGLTRKTIKAYEACGKVNSVTRLKADLAALALYTQSWSEAYDLSRRLAKDCAEFLTWDPISKFALEGALQAHRELNMGKDEDWENLGLAYLRACALVDKDKEQGLEGVQIDFEELKRTVEGLRESDTEQDVEEHKAFAIRIMSGQADHAEDGDQTSIEIGVNNVLPVPIEVDHISVDLTDMQGETISFSNEGEILQPGDNTIKAICSTSTQGLYSLQIATVSLGSVNFIYNKAEEEYKLRVKRDPRGVEARLRMPYDIKLDEDTKVVVEIKAGVVEMKDVKMSLRSLVGEVTYLVQVAQMSEQEVNVDESALVNIGDLDPGEDVDIAIPYTGIPQGEYAKAQIVLQYETSSGPREWIDTQVIFMGLPLTVNVQDFFRPECLLSHFTIASDGREYLRIASVELSPPQEGSHAVEACKKQWENSATITPHQPLSCLFKVRKHGKADGNGAVLRLRIRYRSLEEEVRIAIENAFQKLPSSSRDSVRRIAGEWARDRGQWLRPYLLGTSLAETLSDVLWSQHVEGSDELLKAIENDPVEMWRTLEIPVDVPQHRLLTTVRISPASSRDSDAPKEVYEGRAINMKLTLSTSHTWSGSDPDSTKERILVFDISNNEDWLILGKKKGYYTPDPTKPEEQIIILIPLKSGQLFLPNVNIQLLQNPNSNSNPNLGIESDRQTQLLCETYFENAAQSITVLPAKKEVNAIVPIPVATNEIWEGERI